MIIQLADPDIIQWTMGTARKAAEEAGRDPAALKCIVCAPSHISDDLAAAREQVRWFPAMVSNHVRDLIGRYGADGSVVPKALTDYVPDETDYDYDEHSRVGAKHGAFVSDEICDRFCVLGTPEQAREKLAELEAIGVDQFNIYLMTEGQERDPRDLRQGDHPRFPVTESMKADPRRHGRDRHPFVGRRRARRRRGDRRRRGARGRGRRGRRRRRLLRAARA